MKFFDSLKDIYCPSLSENDSLELAKYASALTRAQGMGEDTLFKVVAHGLSQITEEKDIEVASRIIDWVKENQ